VLSFSFSDAPWRMTYGKSRMRQFRTSGSVRGAAREGGPYRDDFEFRNCILLLGERNA
jgi:hypothetical protein